MDGRHGAHVGSADRARRSEPGGGAVRDRPLETVEDARRRAKRRLPRQVYDALWAGSQAGVTLRENVRAFSRIYVNTVVGDMPSEPRTETTVMGMSLSMPVLIAPVGAQGIQPEAELAVARAAAAAGTATSLSSFASHPIEPVAAANDKTLFQLFWIGGRDEIVARLHRVREAGAVGLIVTLDWSFPDGRDWGSPYIPANPGWKAMAPYVPQALVHPSWLLGFLKQRRIPDLEVPNLATDTRPKVLFFEAYWDWMQTPPPTWEDLAWLRGEWDGPLMIKGILDPDDARKAVDIGATAISVSNHGGNDMDGAIPSIAALPAVVEAVGDQVEILLDSGVRRGSDVIKAVAMGARAVMIGRAHLWALAARGEAGVSEILEVFRRGIIQGLRATGVGNIADLGGSHVIVPEHFYDSQDPESTGPRVDPTDPL